MIKPVEAYARYSVNSPVEIKIHATTVICIIAFLYPADTHPYGLLRRYQSRSSRAFSSLLLSGRKFRLKIKLIEA